MGEGIGDIDLAAVRGDRNATRNKAVDGACGLYGVGRRVDPRDGAEEIADIDLVAVRGDRHALWSDADGDWKADHGVGRRVDHRDVAAAVIGDIDLAA